MTENHPVSTYWVLTMVAKSRAGLPPTNESHVSYFRAVAQCQILVLA